MFPYISSKEAVSRPLSRQRKNSPLQQLLTLATLLRILRYQLRDKIPETMSRAMAFSEATVRSRGPKVLQLDRVPWLGRNLQLRGLRLTNQLSGCLLGPVARNHLLEMFGPLRVTTDL